MKFNISDAATTTKKAVQNAKIVKIFGPTNSSYFGWNGCVWYAMFLLLSIVSNDENWHFRFKYIEGDQ